MFLLPVLGTLAVLAASGAAYLRIAKHPSVVEGCAVAWTGGWGGVNLGLVSLNQFAGVRLTGGLADSISLVAMLAAAVLLWPVRGRFRPWLAEAARRSAHVLRALRADPALAAVAALLALFLAFSMFKAVSLPVMNTDGITYHAAIPRDAFRTGSLPTDVGPAWTEWTRAFPDLLETQALWLYLLDGSANDLWARPLVPVSFGLLVPLVALIARRGGASRMVSLAAPLFIVSLPEMPLWTTQMFAEVPVALATLTGAAVLIAGVEDGDRPLLVLAGLLLGAAGLVKYNGVLSGGALALCGAFLLRSRPSRIPFLVLPWALPVAAVLGRNWVLFGNPVYPFFSEIFGGRNLGLLSLFPAYSPLDQARGRVFEAVELVSALPVVLGLTAVLSRPFRKAAAAWKLLVPASLLYILLYMFFQFRGSHIRYIFPVVPMLALAAAWMLGEASDGSRRALAVSAASLLAAAGILGAFMLDVPEVSADAHASWVAWSGLLAAAALAAIVIIMYGAGRVRAPARAKTAPPTGPGRKALALALAVVLFLPSFPTLLVVGYPGEERPDSNPLSGLSVPTFEQAMARRFGDDYSMWKWINSELPANATLVTFDPRIYYIERNVLEATSYRLAGTYDVPLDKAVEAARREGATHVLDSPWPRDVEVIRPFYERSVIFHNLDNATFFQPVHAEGAVRLYLIAGGGGAGR